MSVYVYSCLHEKSVFFHGRLFQIYTHNYIFATQENITPKQNDFNFALMIVKSKFCYLLTSRLKWKNISLFLIS